MPTTHFKNALILLALLSGCGPGPLAPGLDDGETGVVEPCHTSTLPHNWAEHPASVWAHSCHVEGTSVSCCLAAWAVDGHDVVISGRSTEGQLIWDQPPVYFALDELPELWVSTGLTEHGRVSWEYCGLPGYEQRNLWVEATDLNVGYTASELVVIELDSLICGPVSPTCEPGMIGCPCEVGTCEAAGVVCVESAGTGASICAPADSTEPCDHGLELDAVGIIVGDGCVAGCSQGDTCGPDRECAPIGALSAGFCAWPA